VVNRAGFIIVKNDGTIEFFGVQKYGGDIPECVREWARNNNLQAIEDAGYAFIATSKDNQIIQWGALNSKLFSFPNQKISYFVLGPDKAYALGIDESGRPLIKIPFSHGVLESFPDHEMTDVERFDYFQNGQIFSTNFNESILFTQNKEIRFLHFDYGIRDTELKTSRVRIPESVTLDAIDAVVCDCYTDVVWIKPKDGEAFFGRLAGENVF